MRFVKASATAEMPSVTDAAAAKRLRELQEQMHDVCRPHYHEFYKPVTEHGFTKITLPKKRA